MPSGLGDTVRLLELLFADDTNMIISATDREAAEHLLEETLRAWGQEVAPEKYERINTGEVEESEAELYSSAVRFLGAWVQANGKRDRDNQERLSRASIVWRKVYRQIPRWGLAPLTLGRLVKATVLAALLYG
eukprot:6401441-Pyramimonas_sp.AAC.1